MNTASTVQKWLRTPAAAAYLGFSVPTLEKWRLSGKGPKFRKPGGHAVVYSVCDLEAFAEGESYRSTSEYQKQLGLAEAEGS
jgi:Helix-turn-helix domain